MSTVTFRVLRKLLVSLTTATFLVASVQAPVFADVVSTQEIAQATINAGQRAEVNQFMARNDVADKLMALGVSRTDVSQRINQLTDAEIAQMHAQIETMPAGEGAIGLVIGLLVIFMLLDMAGVTDIFPAI